MNQSVGDGKYMGGWKAYGRNQWHSEISVSSQVWWLTPLIPATPETGIRSIDVQDQCRSKASETTSEPTS
jgi:hypothetical protein